MSGVAQYLRAISIVVANASGNGLELSSFTVRFQVHHNTFTFPHTADIRIYNLADATVKQIGKEFTNITVQAGYQGNYGTIFIGTIKQVRDGRENATDSFVDIFAADGDEWHDFGTINGTLQSGYSQSQVWQQIGVSIASSNSIAPPDQSLSPKGAPRGRAIYGMTRDCVRDFGATNGLLTTTDQGMLTAQNLLAYKPGDAIVINSLSGMVGIPEQTDIGINVSCLLNPAVCWGKRIQINQADIAQDLIQSQYYVQGQSINPQLPSVAADGFYKVLTVDHVGNTRDNEYYSHIICMSLDPTSTAAFGIGGKGYGTLQTGAVGGP